VRRMDGGGLTEAEIERMGVALMRLEEKVGEMAGRFGLKREELRLGLGPLGQLL
ncbi:MAG: gas vesicle protein K, partial [Lysobacteraceae bacterium]